MRADTLDTIHFGPRELHFIIDNEEYVVRTKGGVFYGMAVISGTSCTAFNLKYSEADFEYLQEEAGQFIPMTNVKNDIATKLNNMMWDSLYKDIVEKSISKEK